jgi:hypothetical protein
MDGFLQGEPLAHCDQLKIRSASCRLQTREGSLVTQQMQEDLRALLSTMAAIWSENRITKEDV